MIKVIIDEMLKGNFSFLILVIGVLQLVVMIKSQRRKREVKDMTPAVYENIKELSYSELLKAIDNIREKLYDAGDEVQHADFMYYIALVQELDNRHGGES